MALVQETLHPFPTRTPILESDPAAVVQDRSAWGVRFSDVSRIVNAAGHISATAPFVAVALVTVTFAAAQKDTNYQIGLSWDTLTGFIWNNKSINGFDIVSIGGIITGNVDWILVR